MILGIGTDLVNIERVRKVLDRFGDRFEKRVFSELEIQRSRRKYDPSSSYAKRWAAKEACSKALGIGLRMGFTLRIMHTAFSMALMGKGGDLRARSSSMSRRLRFWSPVTALLRMGITEENSM